MKLLCLPPAPLPLPTKPPRAHVSTAVSICCQIDSRLMSSSREVEIKDDRKIGEGRRSILGQNNGNASTIQPLSNIAVVLVTHLSPYPPVLAN